MDHEQERREYVLRYEIRREQGAARVKPLGRDRYCNRYWWLDGALGAIAMNAITDLQSSAQSNPDPMIAQEVATGVLFVEQFVDDTEMLPRELFDPSSELRAGVLDGKWGYYSGAEQVLKN